MIFVALLLLIDPARPFAPLFPPRSFKISPVITPVTSAISFKSIVVQKCATTSPDTPSLDDTLANVASLDAEATKVINAAKTTQEIEDIRLKYLGKKGSVTSVMSLMRTFDGEGKKKLGAAVNDVKTRLEGTLIEKKDAVDAEEMTAKMASERIDVTMPGIKSSQVGRRHPLSMIIERATDCFVKLGYDTVTECADR